MTIANVHPNKSIPNLVQALMSRKGQAATTTNQTSIQTSASASSQATPSVVPGEGTGQANDQLTMQGFSKAWGTSDARYDLDRSGVVDIDDVTQWVLRLAGQGGHEPKPTEPGPSAQPPEAAPLTQQGFEAAWGTSNQQYDLDGDGTVDTDDWTRWTLGLPAIPPGGSPDLASSPGAGESAATDVLQNGNEPADGTAAGEPAQATLEGVASSWGGSDPVNDVNGDGVVNIDDYTAVVLGQTPQAAGQAGEEAKTLPAEPVGAPVTIKKPRRDIDLQPAPESRRKAGKKADPLTNRLLLVLRRLRAAGIHDHSVLTAKLNGGKGLEEAMGNVTSDVDARTRALTGQLINELRRSGFASRPPQNIRDLVSAMHLDPSQEKYVMGRLGAAYPNGLGVNAMA